jgi:DNA-directed RNA polymerase specialized sigma24 family protein
MAATDDQLIAGTMRGDAEALRELLQRLRPRCKGTLWDRFRALASAFSAELDEPVVPPPEASYRTEALEEAIDGLAEEHREVIAAEVRFQRGEGHPLPAVLGVRSGAARMRLNRARAALFRALVDKGLIEPQEKTHAR